MSYDAGLPTRQFAMIFLFNFDTVFIFQDKKKKKNKFFKQRSAEGNKATH